MSISSALEQGPRAGTWLVKRKEGNREGRKEGKEREDENYLRWGNAEQNLVLEKFWT